MKHNRVKIHEGYVPPFDDAKNRQYFFFEDKTTPFDDFHFVQQRIQHSSGWL